MIGVHASIAVLVAALALPASPLNAQPVHIESGGQAFMVVADAVVRSSDGGFRVVTRVVTLESGADVLARRPTDVLVRSAMDNGGLLAGVVLAHSMGGSSHSVAVEIPSDVSVRPDGSYAVTTVRREVPVAALVVLDDAGTLVRLDSVWTVPVRYAPNFSEPLPPAWIAVPSRAIRDETTGTFTVETTAIGPVSGIDGTLARPREIPVFTLRSDGTLELGLYFFNRTDRRQSVLEVPRIEIRPGTAGRFVATELGDAVVTRCGVDLAGSTFAPGEREAATRSAMAPVDWKIPVALEDLPSH